MKKLAAVAALAVLLSATACGQNASTELSAAQNASYKPNDEHVADEQLAAQYIQQDPARDQVNGKTIYWLSYYDLNPINNQDRSVALQLFQDLYGGSVQYISCTSENFPDVLASRLLAGDPVDMCPYEWNALPSGVSKGQFQPLDPYLDLSDPIWDDMQQIIESYTYQDAHYVVPYCVSDPLILTYSRSLCAENGIEDPYTCYQNGTWNWDTFLEMMTTFVQHAPAGTTRFGINGWFGQAMLISSGDTIVRYDGSQFSNNIRSAAIESAEGMLEQIASRKLYDSTWCSYYPEDRNTLFYAMADWALQESNVKHVPDPAVNAEGFVAENDLMVVPFPKSPDTEEYYLSCNVAAKMLAANSDNGAAVAAYIKCERLAATIDEYRQTEKQKKLIPEKNAAGVLRSYLTEEQYDAIQSYRDPARFTPLFDFGYGMGTRMFSDGSYTYETRGIMDNLTSALLNGERDEWAILRDEWSPVIDSILAEYNEGS